MLLSPLRLRLTSPAIRIKLPLTGITMTNFSTSPGAAPSIYETEKYIFFYGHELQLPSGHLQQWFPSSFTSPSHPGIRFQTAEHYTMYRKAMTFSDDATATRVVEAATPNEARSLGREVRGFDGDVWKRVVAEVAEETNWLKFSQVGECRDALLGTGEKVLVEANPDDRNWGIGFRGDEAEGHEEEWGRNLLGKALMRVRSRLRKDGTGGGEQRL